MRPLQKNIFTSLILLFLGTSLYASSSWYVSGEVVAGPRDYRERTADAGFFYKRPRKKRQKHFVEGGWGFASRTAYGVRNSTQTTVTWMGGLGLDLAHGFGVDGSYWMTPGPQVPGDGSYQARGADGGVSSRWRGMLPFVRWPGRRSVQGNLYLSGGWAVQEQYFIAPEAFGWYAVHQSNAGAALTWKFFDSFSLGAEGRLYSYNRDLEAESLTFVPLAAAGVAGPYDLILGFPARSWGFKAGQDLWFWGDLSVRWRRTEYVLGVFPWSDTVSAAVGLYLWRGCGIRARYEVNDPMGGPPAKYQGVAVELGF